jgi:hypothetical protein
VLFLKVIFLNEENPEIRKEILERIESAIPKDAGHAKAVYEGPDIAVYVDNIEVLYRDEMAIRGLSAMVKKKIMVRSTELKRMEQEKADAEIRQIVPLDAGLNEIRFIPEFGEVYIEATKPGLVIGKGGSTLKSIIMHTNWVPKVLRTPTMNSDVIKGVRQMLYKESAFRKKFLSAVGVRINSPIAKSEWIKATALGGYKEVGRSCTLLETNHSKILIDCGLSPEPSIRGSDAASSDENKAFPYLDNVGLTINEIDAVILTHAHMDHIGFVPYLFKFGYEGPVYCTPPSRDLAALLLYDYIKLVQRSGGSPLYDEKDVRKTLMHMITRDYGEVTNVTDEIKLTYHNAGHILGSSTLHLHIGEGAYNIVHTGDMKYGFTRLFDPADTRYTRIDSLFIESTYGGNGNITKNRQEAELEFMNTIKRTVTGGGKVLVPLFAVGRSQEIMLVLENYMTAHPDFKLDVPVYLDGMLLEASAIHTAYPEYLKEGLERRILNNRSPFESEIFEIAKGERNSVMDGGPAVILASGGMLNGGAGLEYFKEMSPDSKNKIIFVGYNSGSSIGRKLQNGATDVVLPGSDGKLETFPVKLNIETVDGFSGHSDRRELMNFVSHLRPSPKKIFTMHGEESKCEDLARALGNRMRVEARAPMNLDTIRFK